MKNLKMAFLLLLAVLLSYDAYSQSLSLTLDDCRAMAMEGNNSVVNAGLDVSAAKYQKQEALSAYFPVISFSAMGFKSINPLIDVGITDIMGSNDLSNNLQNLLNGYGMMYGFKTRYQTMDYGYLAGFTLMQPVYAGGRIVNSNALAALGVKAAEIKKDMAVKVASEDVDDYWWAVISLQEKQKLVSDIQVIVDTLSSLAGTATSAGLVTDTDLLTVKLRQSELKSASKQLEGGIRLSKMNLFNAIGLPYRFVKSNTSDTRPYIDDVNLVSYDNLPESPEKYYRDEQEILDNLDETKLLGLQVEATELQKKLAVGEALPEIGIGGTYGYAKMVTSARFNGLAFASLKIPITDWGKASRKIKRMETSVQKARNDRDYLESQLRLQIGKLYLDVTANYDQWQLAKERSATSQLMFKRMQEQYNAGLVSLTDLLKIETEYSQARGDELDALIAYRNAVKAYTRRFL